MSKNVGHCLRATLEVIAQFFVMHKMSVERLCHRMFRKEPSRQKLPTFITLVSWFWVARVEPSSSTSDPKGKPRAGVSGLHKNDNIIYVNLCLREALFVARATRISLLDNEVCSWVVLVSNRQRRSKTDNQLFCGLSVDILSRRGPSDHAWMHELYQKAWGCWLKVSSLTSLLPTFDDVR